MNDIADAEQRFINLRNQINYALLATLSEHLNPEASYAPCVCCEGIYYLFLSDLARHTNNLSHNSKISLMLLEESSESDNPFARPRLSLYGKVEEVARCGDCFATVMTEFHHRFGKVMQVIEALPDFHLFAIKAESGSYIQGFGQAYQLSGENLDRLRPIDPRK